MLDNDGLIIEEQKTGKIRQVSISESFKEILNNVSTHLTKMFNFKYSWTDLPLKIRDAI